MHNIIKEHFLRKCRVIFPVEGYQVCEWFDTILNCSFDFCSHLRATKHMLGFSVCSGSVLNGTRV